MIMSNDYDCLYVAFKAIGSISMRLPFSTSLESISADSFTLKETAALQHSLRTAVAVLMNARRDYQLGEAAIEACADGVATELVRIFTAGRIKHNSPKERMRVDGYEWELMFDPGSTADELRTDEKGRVWRKLQAEADDLDDLPF